MKEFNPKEFKGKNVVTVKIKNYQGLRYIYDWDKTKKIYRKRTKGKKYCVTKKIRGQQQERYFESFEDAKTWRTDKLGIDTELSKKTFGDIKNKYFQHIKSQIAHTTFKTYQNNSVHLCFFDEIPLEELTAKLIDQWLEDVKKESYLKKCKTTRLSFEKEIKLLKQIFNYYTEYHEDSFKSPLKRRHAKDCIVSRENYLQAKVRKKQNYMTEKEQELFLAFLKNDPREAYYILALLQLHSGLRIGEAASLFWEDIDWQKGKASICKNVQFAKGKNEESKIKWGTKTYESRWVPLSNLALEALNELYSKSTHKQGLVLSSHFKPLQYKSIQNSFDRAFKALKMPYRGTHILRHSFSTRFQMLTQDQFSLSKILGHSSTKQTEHYAKITDLQVEESSKRFNESIGEGKVLPFKAAAG